MNAEIFDIRGKRIPLGGELGRGGEATIYEVNRARGMLAKIYHPNKRPNVDKLQYMAAHPPIDPTAAKQHTSIAWPRELLYDAHHMVAGFTMPRVMGAVPLVDVFNPKVRKQTLPSFNWIYLHHTASNLASAINAIHAGRYVIGDINESNIMVSNTALITLIDTDSFQVHTATEVHKCLVGKPEYTAPELQDVKSYRDVVRRKEHDYFGLAVIIFQLLMEGRHPFQSRWLPPGEPPPQPERIKRGLYPYARNTAQEIAPAPGAPPLAQLHPAIVDLFQRCFEEGHINPDRRPSADDWKRVLDKAIPTLRECPNKHIYSDHDQRGRCPLCTSGSTVHAGTGAHIGQQTALPPTAPATVQCPQCKHDNTATEIYCRRCHGPLHGQSACPFCSKLMPRGAQHCPSCGVQIATGAMPCPGCGRVNQAGSIYCQRCARQLVPNESCAYCRKPRPRGAPFCPHCGK